MTYHLSSCKLVSCSPGFLGHKSEGGSSDPPTDWRCRDQILSYIAFYQSPSSGGCIYFLALFVILLVDPVMQLLFQDDNTHSPASMEEILQT